jgi:hypothetical protein|tara:strand:- start:27 stop:287 length:261 start_codon:yes stop_codon:yes gene_type:complete
MFIPSMVKVVWLDTNECSLSAWQSKEELLKSKPCTIDSLGYLIEENEDYIIISGDKDNKNEDDIFGRSQVIPKGVVIKIQYLQEKL